MDKNQLDESVNNVQSLSQKKTSESTSWLITGFMSAVTTTTSLVPPIIAAISATRHKTKIQIPFVNASLALLGISSGIFSIFSFKEAAKVKTQNAKFKKQDNAYVDLNSSSFGEVVEGNYQWQNSVSPNKDKSTAILPNR